MTDGLLLVVGSGLSTAEGIPGMADLAAYMNTHIGAVGESDEWRTLSVAIQSVGLEAALLKHPPSTEAESLIGTLTTEFIELHERAVLKCVFQGTKTLRLSRLLDKLVIPATGLPVVTTNYDRLVEVAAEEAGMGVDTLFNGRFAAPFNPVASAEAFCTGIAFKGKTKPPTRHMRKRITVFKPHGSLDWYERAGRPVQCMHSLQGIQRLLITPGHNKFRNGYASPFDQHRSKANEAINRAQRFLILGYGFNDDHLETHLSAQIQSGKPTLILSKQLSSKVMTWSASNKALLALEYYQENLTDCTRVTWEGQTFLIPNKSLWDLEHLINEAL
jgi:hypothetical protein